MAVSASAHAAHSRLEYDGGPPDPANGSLPLRCFFQNCVAQALSRRDEPQRRHNK